MGSGISPNPSDSSVATGPTPARCNILGVAWLIRAVTDPEEISHKITCPDPSQVSVFILSRPNASYSGQRR